MEIGDLVVRKSYDKDITFKIIDIKKDENGNDVYVLKGISIRIIADSKSDDLEKVSDRYVGKKEKILNSRVNAAIKRAISLRGDNAASEAIDNATRGSKSQKLKENRDLIFGRPGKYFM